MHNTILVWTWGVHQNWKQRVQFWVFYLAKYDCNWVDTSGSQNLASRPRQMPDEYTRCFPAGFIIEWWDYIRLHIRYTHKNLLLEHVKEGCSHYPWVIDVLFPLFGWFIEGFKTTPEKSVNDDRWYTKPAPLFLPKGHYCHGCFQKMGTNFGQLIQHFSWFVQRVGFTRSFLRAYASFLDPAVLRCFTEIWNTNKIRMGRQQVLTWGVLHSGTCWNYSWSK